MRESRDWRKLLKQRGNVEDIQTVGQEGSLELVEVKEFSQRRAEGPAFLLET